MLQKYICTVIVCLFLHTERASRGPPGKAAKAQQYGYDQLFHVVMLLEPQRNRGGTGIAQRFRHPFHDGSAMVRAGKSAGAPRDGVPGHGQPKNT